MRYALIAQTVMQFRLELAFLVQALAKIHDFNSKIQLLFVSSYSQFVIETDEIAYEKSPVLGLIKTLA